MEFNEVFTKKMYNDHQKWLQNRTKGKRLCLAHLDLTGANLRGACFSMADLLDTNFTGADLTDADLVGAYVWKTNFTGAILKGAVGLKDDKTAKTEKQKENKMNRDILIKARIVSKEWQIKECEKIIKDTAESISERLTIIGLLDDNDMPVKGYGEHRHLYKLLREIDSQEELRLGLNQELLKLNNADGYCQCDSCVANRAYLGDKT